MACCGKKKNKGRAIVTFVDKEEAKRRLEICRSCAYWTFGICAECGCITFLKTKTETLNGQIVDCGHPEGSKWKQA